MTEREALKLALEYVELVQDDRYNAEHIDREALVTAIKEALAQPEQLISDQINYGMSVTQGGKRIDPMSIYKEPKQEPEQEPVACVEYIPCCPDQTCPKCKATTPPQRKPLTDEEIVLIVAECAASHQHTDIHFARAIEAAHGIKGEA